MPSDNDNMTADDATGADETAESHLGLQPNTVSGTLIVASVLCLVCSLLVSGTAVALRGRIAENENLNRQRNVLMAAGLYDPAKDTSADVTRLFEQVQAIEVQLPRSDNSKAEAGTIVEKPQQVTMVSIPPDLDLAGIKSRESVAEVYVVNGPDGKPQQFVLPVYGKGLWSTLYGYLAISADVAERMPVVGITFYKQKETPGLGGEVENPKWKAQWPGKKLFDADWQPVLDVTKPGNAQGPTEVDGISGATVTSNGVQGLVNYWLGPDGLGPFLERYRKGELDLPTETPSRGGSAEATTKR